MKNLRKSQSLVLLPKQLIKKKRKSQKDVKMNAMGTTICRVFFLSVEGDQFTATLDSVHITKGENYCWQLSLYRSAPSDA